MSQDPQRRIGLRQSLATKLALQVGWPFVVVALAGVALLRLPTHAALAAVLLVAGMGVAYAVTLRTLLSRQLARLTTAMERAERGDFIVRADARGRDEIADLARRFNAMLAKITDMNVSQIENRRELELIQNELRLTAQLDAQKTQIEESNRRLEGACASSPSSSTSPARSTAPSSSVS